MTGAQHPVHLGYDRSMELTEAELTKITTAPGRTSLDLMMEATLAGGVVVPCEVFIVYPEGNGLHAVNAAARMLEQNRDELYSELLARQDAALVNAMLESGAMMDEEDGE